MADTKDNTGSVVLREFDEVRIVQLHDAGRWCDGVAAPQVGDVGIVCHDLSPGDPTSTLVVEMMDEAGQTVWIADFHRDELLLVNRPTK